MYSRKVVYYCYNLVVKRHYIIKELLIYIGGYDSPANEVSGTTKLRVPNIECHLNPQS